MLSCRDSRVFPSLNTFNLVYLTWSYVENDCSNKSMSALVKHFHSVDCGGALGHTAMLLSAIAAAACLLQSLQRVKFIHEGYDFLNNYA